MTVAVAGAREGVLRRVVAQTGLDTDTPKVELSETPGKIQPDLTVGADVTSAKPLRANEKLEPVEALSLHGAGFIVTPKEAAALGLGAVAGLERHILAYRNGRDLTARPRGVMVIDLFPLTETEVRDRFPAVYQWVADRVRPQREGQRGKTKDATEYADRWWLFGKPGRNSEKHCGGCPAISRRWKPRSIGSSSSSTPRSGPTTR